MQRESRLVPATDVGDTLGQGNCFYNMAEVERRRLRFDDARALYLRALILYEKVREPTSIGLAKKGLFQISVGPERRAWLAGAKEAWADLPHLLAQLEGA